MSIFHRGVALLAQVLLTLSHFVQRTWKRATLVFAIVIGAVFLYPTAAFAAADGEGALIVPFNLDWIVLLRLVAIPVLLPALVGAINRVTPGNWPTFVKRAMLAAAALLQSLAVEFLSAYDAGVAYDLWSALGLGVLAYVVAELTYLGFYKAPLRSGDHVATATEAVVIQPIDPLPASTTKAAAIEAFNGLAADVSGAVLAPSDEVAPPVTIASKIAGK